MLFASLCRVLTQKVHIRVVLFKNVVSILVVFRDKIFASAFNQILYFSLLRILALRVWRVDRGGRRIILQPGRRLRLRWRPLQTGNEAHIDLRRSNGSVLLVKLRHLKRRIVGHLRQWLLFLRV